MPNLTAGRQELDAKTRYKDTFFVLRFAPLQAWAGTKKRAGLKKAPPVNIKKLLRLLFMYNTQQ